MPEPLRRVRQALGTTERRVVLAIVLTALVPFLATTLLTRTLVSRISATAFQPEFGAQLERSLGVYGDLVKAVKQGMRAEAEAIAASEALRAAASRADAKAVEVELRRQLASHPSLAKASVESAEGNALVRVEREAPIDPKAERTLEVRRPLAPDAAEPLDLVAVFATPAARFAEMEAAQEFVQAYHQIERDHRREYVDDTYRGVFAALVGATVVLAFAAGVGVVRPVTKRIARLAAATRPVAEGDLSVRVDDRGADEVAHLARAFNTMLEELEQSRARVEFLRRVGEWQKIGRRLAHEIKNPLTPIQLAVQECHKRYTGDDPAFKRILQTTLEVVEEEVGSLRRLVGEFSSFARLPRAEIAPGDVAEFLRDQADHLVPPASERAPAGADASDDRVLFARTRVRFELPEGSLPALFDREMLHRVLLNVVRNAAQAIRDERASEPGDGAIGEVRVTASVEGPWILVDVDDDGPGVDPSVRPTIFDPYVTTKHDGTGLGLAIVKKILVDHGGTVDVLDSPLGGARFRLRVPRAGTPESEAARERAAAPDPPERTPPSSRAPRRAA
jgi:nitrogen fixation/metabolism regulation signal transduction histidine kinase